VQEPELFQHEEQEEHDRQDPDQEVLQELQAAYDA
jgi:hypothetical protein